MLLQLLFIFALIPACAFLSYWARRANLQGFELWLPLSIVFSFGISPWVGFVFAMTVVFISWAAFPYELQGLAIMALCLLPTLLASSLFSVSEANFVQSALLLTLAYNIVSNAAYLVMMGNWFNALKFFAFSMWVSWLLYSNFGWQLVTWLSSG